MESPSTASRRIVLCALVSAGLTASTAARAREPRSEPEAARPEPPEPMRLGLDAVRGFRAAFRAEGAEGAAPDATAAEAPAASEPKETQALSLIAAMIWPLSSRVGVGVRVPVTTSTFRFSAYQTRQITALGNVELAGTLRVPLGSLESELELGIALPTATGDEYGAETDARSRGYANLAAQRFRGYLDNALFAAHRFGVVPGWRVALESPRASVEGFVKLELLMDAGVTPPPPELGELSKTAAELVGGARVQLAPFPSRVFRLGLRSWMAWTLVGEVKEPDRTGGARPPRAQVVLDPELSMEAGRLRSSVGFLIPAGGILGRTEYRALQLTLAVEL